jgi:hypothetical protein
MATPWRSSNPSPSAADPTTVGPRGRQCPEPRRQAWRATAPRCRLGMPRQVRDRAARPARARLGYRFLSRLVSTTSKSAPVSRASW